MGRLIFVRHGQSLANAEERFTHGPHEGLSERGEREADARGAALVQRFAPTRLYTSPFVRARQTAVVLARHLSLEPIVVEDLREQHFGELRGRPYSALGDSSRDGLARWEYRPPGGETLREVAERVGPAVVEIAERERGEEVVIVSHGGVMAALRAWWHGGYDRPPELSGNASGFWVPYGDGGFGELNPLGALRDGDS